jgi:hypothetical protein
MSITISPSDLISGAITSLVDSAVIIGMPATGAPVPMFVLCETPKETMSASARLPGALMQTGELRARTVIEASHYEFDAVLSDIPMNKNQDIFRVIQIALADAAAITNSLASYGAVLPNLSGLSVGYVSSSISVLNQIKNNMMPVTVLGSYFSLGVVQQTTPYLSSSWYIESIDMDHESVKAGTVVHIKLKEQFNPRDLSALGIVKAIAGETISPLAGSAIGAFA